MNLNQLRYFVTVAQKLNFTEAAKQHFVTQPAISHQVSDLEKRVGAALLDRSERQLSLTPAGEEFYKYAQQILDLEQGMTTRLANVSEGRVGHLRISAVPSSLPELSDCLLQFSRQFPDIQIEVDVGTGMEQLDCMHKNTHDLYCTFYTHACSQKNMDCIPTSENRFALIVHKSDVDKVDLNDFSSLADRPLVMEYHATGPFLVDKVLRLCRARGRNAENILACSSYQSVSLMVNANLGFAILPMNMARSCYGEHIDIFPIPGSDAVNINAISWTTPIQNKAVESFLSTVQTLFPPKTALIADRPGG
jgi:DNA-binding transcriptional LysR family regulator